MAEPSATCGHREPGNYRIRDGKPRRKDLRPKPDFGAPGVAVALRAAPFRSAPPAVRQLRAHSTQPPELLLWLFLLGLEEFVVIGREEVIALIINEHVVEVVDLSWFESRSSAATPGLAMGVGGSPFLTLVL